MTSATRRLILMMLKSVMLAAAAAAALLAPAPASAQGAYNFCPIGESPIFSVVNGVDIYRFDPGASSDTLVTALSSTPVPADLNALMVDPVRNRLLFVSRNSGGNVTLWAYDAANPAATNGWYIAAGPIAAPDFPRAAMAPNGVGYMIGNAASPSVWTVTADPAPGSFGYTIQPLPNPLTYDIAPTNLGSGDIAFDATGVAWLSAGQDLYAIDFSDPTPVAVRQARPLLNGSPSTISWAGVAFAADGRLFVADNTAASAYYGYDPATGALTPAAPTTARASRDLASCAFPAPAEPELSVTKTLAEVNDVPYAAGAPVTAGDELSYAITVSNSGNAVGTLFAGDVDETLPANTTFVAAGSNFTCTGSACQNGSSVNVAAGASAVLTFNVRVNSPLPAGVTAITNGVLVADVDCTSPGNDCGEVTPVGPGISVTKTSNPASGAQVTPGQTISYTLSATITNSATTEAVTLADTLDAGLTFGSVTSAGVFTCSGSLSCELPAGTAPGTYALTYTATVDATATGSVGNSVVATNPPGGDPDPVCTSCTTEHNIVASTVTVTKTSNPASGTTVNPGQAISYTLTAVVANSATTQVLTLADSLGAGLTFGAVTDAGAFTCSGSLSCELPAGTAPGSYALTYTATVDAAATGSVGNSVTATNPPGGDPDPVCTSCTTEHDIVAPAISVTKTANPAAGSTVTPGQSIAYSLTAVVANSATTEAVTLTDTLGAGLAFGAVTNAGAFTCSGSLSCELPAGTLPGSYTVTYSVTVDAAATGTVGNVVTATNPPGGDPDPVCTTCTTAHDVALAEVSVTKTSDPVSGTTVAPGDTIQYTLTAIVTNAATTQAVTLADTLDAGLTFGAVTNTGAFTCSGSLSCELPAGTLPGTYALTYTATVDAAATGSIGNSVTATNPPGGDPDPVCTSCTTEHNVVAPTVTVTKTANPAAGSTVMPGQSITYSLTAVVANSATTQTVTLTDTLGAGLTFGSVTNAGIFTCSGGLSCELPAGTLPGSYTVTYSVTVDAAATGSVGNSVTATNPPGGDPDPVCTSCTTEHDVALAEVSVTKTSNPANGATVTPGDTIQYTLTTIVANSITTQAVTLVDTLDAGLTFGSVTNAGAFTCSGSLSCELPAGTEPGSYALTYTATVDAAATGSVGNSVTATNPPGGDPDPVCTSCTTEHDIAPAEVSVTKTSNPANGATVTPGDTIQYTLTTIVANSITTQAVTLADTLDTGLTFGSVTSAGAFTCSGSLSCELPAGTTPGSYALTYTATVDAAATGSVGNSVAATNPPGGDPDPICISCTTEHDIVTTGINVTKTANPSSGSTVRPGDTITYMLSVTVAQSATTQPLILSDTLDADLLFGAVTNAGSFTCSGSLSCELPAGTLPGNYSLEYTATVAATATGAVGNSVAATNPPGGDPDPVCTSCTTEHDIVPSTVAVTKTSNPASGSTVNPGQSIEYSVTATVANSMTTEVVTLTDTLGAGLTFGAVTNAGNFNCSGSLVCALPAGTPPGAYTFTYTASIDAGATGSVGNSVVATNPPGGDPDPVCTGCTTEHDIVASTVTVTKTSDPASGSTVNPGQVIAYTLTAIVANSATTQPVTLTDTLGAGLTFGAVTNAGSFACSGSLSCVLPAGTLPGAYTLTYTATVDAAATGALGNSVTATNPPGGDPDPICTTCTTEHDIVASAVTVSKTSNPASGSTVSPGQTISYTLTAVVANSVTTQAVTLTDTLGAGLTFSAVTNAGSFTCSGSLTCELPAGTAPGTYSLSYTASIDAGATGSVGNSVVATNPPGGDPDPVCTSCTTEHEIVASTVTVTKTSDPASGSTVNPGQVIGYTLTAIVANSATTQPVTLTDTLGAGLTIGAVTNAGSFACSGSLSCVLPAGTLPGAYTLTYTATVDAAATGALGNSVTATNPPGGDPDPVCTTCTTEHRIIESRALVAKSSSIAAGAEVKVGDVIDYRLTVTIEGSATTEVLTLTDTLGAGLTFGQVTNTGSFTCSGSLRCELAAGTLPGTYVVTYSAHVDASAVGTVENRVVASNAPGGDPDPTCTTCETSAPLAAPRVTLRKSANPGHGADVHVGDAVTYTLTTVVENAATTQPITLTDTPGQGLTISGLPAGCAQGGGTFSCVLPAGTAPGTYSFSYTGTINADATTVVGNRVAGDYVGGAVEVECLACEVSLNVADDASLRIVKSTASRSVKVGDLVRYTLTVENVGAINLSNGVVVDTPPAGFSFVAGSMAVADRDGAFSLTGNSPLRIGGLDIAAGGRATIVYLLRVGAGVRGGTHINQAVALGVDSTPISNVATAQVTIETDPLLDDSLIFGTVFDDRDGDGWQDRADLADVAVKGGFAATAYVPGSTSIDRGHGPEPIADASAPMLHGIALGTLAPGEQLVIRQRLSALAFTNDFALTGDGVTLHMDTQGAVRVERRGDAAKGLRTAEPTAERRVAPVDGGWEVTYVIANAGRDERGLAGVRIASVEGLLIETDQHGRYHLLDIPGGTERGRNFILKVDPATLPRGAVFTTRNPLVRRITPGIPVRFDFGVRLPVAAPEPAAAELEIGAALFKPDSPALSGEHDAVLRRMADALNASKGGTILITAAPGDEALAFARAIAIREALEGSLDPAVVSSTRLSLRSRIEDPATLLAGTHGHRLVLGSALADPAGALRPAYQKLIDMVAQQTERESGTIIIEGPPDGGLFEALATRVSPEVRSRLRLHTDNGAPASAVAGRE